MTEAWIQKTKDSEAAHATDANIVIDCGISVVLAESAVWKEMFE